MVEAAVLFGLCLIGEGIAAMLPFPFPASVTSMLLLAALLLLGVLKEKHIARFSTFLINNMAFFFLPAAVGIMEHLDLLKKSLLPFLMITICTVPLVYGLTAWTVQALMRLCRKKEKHTHA